MGCRETAPMPKPDIDELIFGNLGFRPSER